MTEIKPSKEIFDLVVETIRQECKERPLKHPLPSILETAEATALKKNPNGILILLDIAQHTELKKIPSQNIREAIWQLEVVEKVLKDCSPRQHIFSGKALTFPNVVYPDPNRFSLVIFWSFYDWYSTYLFRKKNTVDNLSLLNLEKVFALVLDIDDKIQVNPSSTITIGVESINAWRFKLLQSSIIVSVSKRVREFRKDALDYLKSAGVINDYKLDYTEDVTLSLDIPAFQEIKAEVIKTYAKWGITNEQQNKKIEPAKLSPDSKWEDITIKFKDGHNVDIKIKDKTIPSDYKTMGFEDKRTRKPDKQWELLIKLSESNGEIDWQSYPQSKNLNKRLTEQKLGFDKDEDNENQNKGFSYKKAPDSTKKIKQLLAKKLKSFFGIKEDPFFSYRKEGSYKIKITLNPA